MHQLQKNPIYLNTPNPWDTSNILTREIDNKLFFNKHVSETRNTATTIKIYKLVVRSIITNDNYFL